LTSNLVLVHGDVERAGDRVPDVRDLTAVGPDDRLDGLGPPPPWLKGRPADLVPGDLHQVHATVVE
jgi:hypothetical protein